MDLARIKYHRWLDFEVVAKNFMQLYMGSCLHDPVAEELVAFALNMMGKRYWNDPAYQMYDMLYSNALTILNHMSEDKNE